MTKGWKTVPLEALAVQEKGAIKIGPFGSQLKKCDLVTSGVHVVGIENVLSGTFDSLGERFISLEKFQKLRTVEILPGDLLITMMGTIGKVAIVPDGIGTSIMDSHLLRVRPDQKLCRTDYLGWAIYGSPAVQQAMDAQAHGSIMQGLNSAIVRSLPILLPPLPEQERIVGLLGQAFDGIAKARANAEKNLQNARALFESHLQSVFTQRSAEWAEHKKLLADLCELIVDCEHKTAPTQEEGIPSIRTPNIGKGKLLLDGVYRVSEETYREWTRRAEPLPGDLILAREAPAGNVAVIPENLKVCLGQRTVLIRPSRKVFEPEFLALTLLQSRMQQKLLAHSRGATVQHVNMKDIRALDVGAIPPLSVQRDIISIVSKASQETQRLESLYQRKLAALDELKKSLLHQAFSGQLTASQGMMANEQPS